MADNVIKFRKIERKGETKGPSPGEPKEPPKWPAWLPWLVIVLVGVVYTAFQTPGLFDS